MALEAEILVMGGRMNGDRGGAQTRGRRGLVRVSLGPGTLGGNGRGNALVVADQRSSVTVRNGLECTAGDGAPAEGEIGRFAAIGNMQRARGRPGLK